jgi:anaerobic magnesium-protoporphyrin IX monomethyl ester cyclase
MTSRRVAFLAAPIMDVTEDGQWVPSLQDADKESPQLGVYLLIGELDRSGRDIDLFDWVANQDWNRHYIVDSLSEYDVVFFSCNSMNWSVIRHIAYDLRTRRLDQVFCVGGPHPTHYPESIVGSGLFDFFFRGEADRHIGSIYDLATNTGQHSGNGVIPGLGSQRIFAPSIVQESALHELNWNPAYYRLPPNQFLSIPVETSRGCKFQCTFCSIPSKKNWRGYDAEFAVSQIEFADKYSHLTRSKKVSIIDDTFTTDHSRTISIMSSLDVNRFSRRLLFDATIVDLLNVDVVSAIAPFASDLLVGAEVASKKDAKNIRKAATPELIWRAAKNLKEQGIADRAVFSFIIGFPWQDRADCVNVLKYVKNLIFEFGVRTYVQWYWPMPGSEIWNGLRDAGKVGSGMVDEIGFFRSNEWFFPFRSIDLDDVIDIDQRAKIVQSLSVIAAQNPRARTMEYASPLEVMRKVNRAPHLVAETK